jgi:DNA processing protein
MDREELGAWLRLLETPRVGRESALRLLAAFGSPQAAVLASSKARREVVGAGRAEGLASPPDALEGLIGQTFDWLVADVPEMRAVIALGDARYPQLLLEAADPPLLQYAQGRLELLHANAIAVVGNRNPTPQGVDNAKAFSMHLSRAGLTIVSGLALGIDTAAHVGALEGPASTIAVVGTGLDRVYPGRNLKLAHRISDLGLRISEYSLGTPPLPPHFPPRNRIIAGLARGTLVVEAALQSGSLITARLASEAGRDVFAIPGSIHSPQSRGCHALIKQGAKLVESAQDILEELNLTSSETAATSCGANRPDRPRTCRTRLRSGHIGRTRCTHRLHLGRTECSTARPRIGGTRWTAARPAVPAGRARLRDDRLGYSEFMFDVLVYLYENYWRPDACPDHDQLTRKLSSVGFESDEIQEALSWLDGVAVAAQSYVGEQGVSSLRVYSPAEQEHLGEDSIGFISFLESAGVLPPPMREMVIDRSSAIAGGPLDLEDLKIIVLMVFWSLGEEPDALILDELFVDAEDRLIH